MRSLGFLFSRRWIAFALVIVFAAWGAWALGEWQFHRLAERKADNTTIRANEHAPVTPVSDVLSRTRPADQSEEYRRVSATGQYAEDKSVIVRYRTRDGASGVDVVVPLVTRDGTALLVDRGWFATDNLGSARAEAPAPPSGEVTVVGRVRLDATGDSTIVTDRSTRSINSAAIGRALSLPVYRGFVDLVSEDPAPAHSPEPADLPDLGNGPHFFYGLQWWFFGLMAVCGFGYLAYDEWLMSTGRKARPGAGATDNRAAQRARSMPPSTGTIAPETNDAAEESRKAATEPNSSGSP